ncbi:MAG: nitrogen regulation protein NR(I) [Alphaproteobacteria bacterium]|nr:nitrogen regulation protein NR(I) [Alphaproteobacteria bacterium]
MSVSQHQATVLVADDDSAIRTVLSRALGRLGHAVRTTGTGGTLWKWVANGEGDLVVTDVMMPDANGLDLLPKIKEIRPDLKVIVMSARNTLLTAVKATEKGAFDYLAKPFDLDELVRTVERALEGEPGAGEAKQGLAEHDDIESEEALPLIGRSPAMQEIYRVMARLMATDLTVMISGESGTGKELIARALHDYGKRREKPFVAVNMAAIPRELIESELFGHEKGAFTGATQRSDGRFRVAQGGTLFLDEIGDMPLEAQTRLLRVLQEGEYTTVGGRQPIKADVRIVAATHRDLREMIKAGTFREDLYYRLNVVPIRVPALRERLEDVPLLVRHFLTDAVAQGLPVKTLDQEAMGLLQRHSWPGNVRELENVIKRIAALYAAETITAEVIEQELDGGAEVETPGDDAVQGQGLGAAVERHLKSYFAAHRGELPTPGLHGRILREVERPLIQISLAATKGNQIKAAELLGLNRNTLRKKIRELDIEVARGGK